MTFQVFDDKAEDYMLAEWRHGKLTDPVIRKWLTSKADEGCGVYVTVSACDGKGRRRANVKYARALFIDLDGEPLPDEWPIEPDIINETSPGKYHAFWLAQNIEDLNAYSDCQARLAARFSADPKVFDPPRVVRLPGFYHQKKSPFRSRTIQTSDRDPSFDRFTLEDIVDAHPADYTPPAARALGGRSEEPADGWDNDADVIRARGYLAAVEPPTPGNRNNAGYLAACRLNDFGISPELSFDLMSEVWNPRLSNPLKDHEIQHVIKSSTRYKASSSGSASLADRPSAADDFGDVELDEPTENTKEFDFEGGDRPEKPKQVVEKPKEFDFEEKQLPIRPEKTIRHNVNGLSYSSMAEIRAEPLTWLWDQRIPRGKLTIIAGYPDQGKSQILLKIAATVTTGGDWPNGEGKAPLGAAIILSSEDDEADTLKPRAAAAGANLNNMYVVRSMVTEVTEREGKVRRVLNIEDDLARLQTMIKDLAAKGQFVRFIGIDPINAYFGGGKKGKADSHKSADMRALLTPLSEWAARMRIAVVVISHFNKGSNSHTLYRITDSSAITAAARAVHVAVRSNLDKPQDEPERLFAPIKKNLAKEMLKGISYQIETEDVSALVGIPNTIVPYIKWGIESDMTADEALGGLSKPGAKTDARDRCKTYAAAWFNDKTITDKDGAITTKKLQSLCREFGQSWGTMVRAFEEMAIVARTRKGKFQGGSEWIMVGNDAGDDFEDDGSPLADSDFG